MTEACRLENLGSGRFGLVGNLGFETAADLLNYDEKLFSGPGAVVLDLGGVTDVDSAGLALLLRWLGVARQLNREVSFDNVPPKLKSLASISDLDDLISD